MKCPYCSSTESKVIDKRESSLGGSTRRRRGCLKCDKRFTTYEKVENLVLNVIKKDGRKEPYSKAKIFAGMQKACEKRPLDRELLGRMADEVEYEVLKQDSTEVSSTFIGGIVMKKLMEVDKVAYLRFASVHREFDDINEFTQEVEKLMKAQS